ncbi:MAG: TetR/AcrR family transcriptional regulator [Nevskia sp.]|nr:TetR/AcrR family transcriptional regulator [Nevskia sp.]
MVDAICEATLRVLLKDGFTRITTTRVAEVAGISVGSLYQYFPNKRALVAEAMRRHLDHIVTTVVEAVRRNRDASLEAFVTAAIDAFMDAKLSRVDVSRALRAPLAEVDGQALVRRAMAAIAAPLCQALMQRASMSAEQAAGHVLVLLTAVEGAVSSTMDIDPARLGTPDFRRSVIGLGVGFVGWISAGATAAPRRS